MHRRFLIALVLLTVVVPTYAGLVTYYEDDFTSPTPNPAWTVWGTGTYNLTGSNLEFTTQQGDLLRAFQPLYGVPKHLFLITPPPGSSQWSAVTRVRYNTPNLQHQQVDLVAFQDQNTYLKFDYQHSGGATQVHALLTEYGSTGVEHDFATPTHTSYFWMRVDRNGNTYTAYVSESPTTNPDLVAWTLQGSLTSLLADPQVGIGGWNAEAIPGQLAEFDYFRIQVPEPATLTLLAAVALTGVGRRRGE